MRVGIAILITATMFAGNVNAEQAFVFKLDSIRVRPERKADACQIQCSFTDSLVPYSLPPLEERLKLGWKVVSTTAKTILAQGNSDYTCTCVGTEYVLQKEEQAAPVPQGAGEALLKKEIELLQKEISLLKQENELLKRSK